jgi:hypothetical protein
MFPALWQSQSLYACYTSKRRNTELYVLEVTMTDYFAINQRPTSTSFPRRSPRLARLDSSATATPSAFCKLPAELRNRIYESTLRMTEPLWNMRWRQRERPDGLGLLRVNKMIHDEATAIFYGQNEFDFTSHPNLNIVWRLHQIKLHVALIRNIRISIPDLIRCHYHPLDSRSGHYYQFNWQSETILSTLQ